MDSLQLDMNLDRKSGNAFRSALENGRFTVLIECSVPSKEIDPASSAERLADLESAVLKCGTLNTGLAITDHINSGSRWRGAEFATRLPEGSRDRHIVYISGSNTSLRQASLLAAMSANAGIPNIVPVSGSVPGHISGVRDCRKIQFAESTGMLRTFRNIPDIFCGCTVNPFQYMAYPLLGQYFKMVKKLNCGAGFLVAQAGWDMLRIQSLAWFMMNRKLFYPMMARLILLTPEKVEEIVAGKHPGIRISNDFRRILERELHYSKNQFEAAQYRRLELQAAGCRLMGFSGIQISGAENPAKAQLVISRINQALKEYTDFNTWLEEYNAYMASAEMAPFSNNFQLYDPILSRDYPMDTGVVSNDIGSPVCGSIENTLLKLKEAMFSSADTQRSGHLAIAKTLLAGCRKCSSCRLPLREYVCPEQCPRRLADGPCGGVKPDGSCELGKFECIHSKIVRFAHKRGTLPELETNNVEQADLI